MRLKERSRFHNIKLQGEAASADVEAGASYPRDPARVTDARGYTKQQIFHCRHRAFYWRKRLCRTFIAREEKSVALASELKA